MCCIFYVECVRFITNVQYVQRFHDYFSSWNGKKDERSPSMKEYFLGLCTLTFVSVFPAQHVLCRLLRACCVVFIEVLVSFFFNTGESRQNVWSAL